VFLSSASVRQQLYERINAMWTEITKIPPERLKITLFDVPTALAPTSSK
jgi:hypothetical protein